MAKKSEENDNSKNSPQKGKPIKYDPTFKGPIKNRGCTDIICSFLFIAFIAGWIVIAGFAYSRGDPRLLLYPTDSNGELCGNGRHLNKTFLVFFDLTKCRPYGLEIKCRTPQVCVEKCPDKSFSFQVSSESEETKKQLICKDGYDPFSSQLSISEMVKNEHCASYYLKSFSVFHRCVPSAIKDEIAINLPKEVNQSAVLNGINNLSKVLQAAELGEKLFQDLKNSYALIIIAFIFAMILSFIWITLMRWIAGFMVYLSIVVVLALLTFGCYFSVDRFILLNSNHNTTDVAFESIMGTSTYDDRKYVWLAFAIISGLLILIILLMMIFLRSRIRIAIALIGEGSRAIGHMMFTLVFPIIPFLFILALFVFWGSVALYLASQSTNRMFKPYDIVSGELVKNVSCTESKKIDEHIRCQFDKYSTDANLNRAQIYNVFGLFWMMMFITGVSQMTMAGAFASYYWAFNKPGDIPAFPILASYWRTLRYHLGSVAFGALIIAIVKFIRMILEYIEYKVKDSPNVCARFCVKCMICCFWCLEKFLKFINKNAYIMIAVYGKNFCTSAKNAFFLLMRNVVRVVVVDNVTDFLMFVGKLVIVGGTGALAFFTFTKKIPILPDNVPEFNYYLMPVIIIIIGSYAIATAFFSVYNMAVDTLFLCFLEDCERNDGTPEKPYYMSKELMKILGKKNQMKS